MEMLTGFLTGELSLAFGFVLFLLLAVFLFLILRVLFAPVSQSRVDHQRMNIELSRAEIAKLKESRQLGMMDEREYEEARDSIERNLASSLAADSGSAGKSGSRWLNTSLAVLLVPLLAVPAILLYTQIGEYRALDAEFVSNNMPEVQQQTAQNSNAGSEKLPSIEELLPRLEAHLQDNPDDAGGWSLLGTTYLRLRRFTDAENALEKAYELAPENPDVMLQLADAKAMRADGVMAGEPVKLVDLALLKVPDDVRALWLKGMASSQAGDHEDAIGRWRKLQPLVADDAEASARLVSMIEDARSQQASTPQSASAEQAAPVGLAVSVELDASLREGLSPSTAVYVYAKASSGPPMPLAVVRKTVADLPLEVVLDDSMAMMPQLKLSAFESVTVGARVSHSGDPVSQVGDFFKEIENINSRGDEAVSLKIDQRVEAR